MKIDFIIPTIFRNEDELNRAVSSIKEEGVDHNILLCGSKKPKDYIGNQNNAVANINEGLGKIRNDSDWIILLDDDDYLNKGFSKELNNEYDITVLRMCQNENDPIHPPKIIPRIGDDNLYSGNVGINFSLKTSFYLKHKWLFNPLAKYPDWDFLSRAIQYTNKIKITKDIYYVAPVGNYYKNK